MKTIYIVTKLIDGYAREDSPTIMVDGAYTDETQAKIHKSVSGGTITPIDVDVMPLGIFQSAKVFGLIK